MDPITLLLIAAGGFMYWRSTQNKAPQVPSLPPPYVPTAPAPAPRRSRTPQRAPSPPAAPKPVPNRPGPTANTPKIKNVQRLDAAAALAQLVLKDITAKGMGYNRKLLSDFQRVANIKVDGKYGSQSAGAVEWYVRPAKVPGPFPQWGKGLKTYHPGF